jgi:hypothetical protein
VLVPALPCLSTVRLAVNETIYRLAEKLSAAAQPLYLQVLLPVSQHPAGVASLLQTEPCQEDV